MINKLDEKYGSLLSDYGYGRDLFNDCLISLYKPTNFNIAILWWFLADLQDSDATKLIFSTKDVG